MRIFQNTFFMTFFCDCSFKIMVRKVKFWGTTFQGDSNTRGHFLGVIFPTGNISGDNFPGGNLPGGNFPGGLFCAVI